MDVEYHKYLPSYRSLLTPNAQYDYKTHQVVQLSQLDLKNIISRFQLKQSSSLTIKMKYKSLLSDVSRKALILSMKMQSSLQNHSMSQQQNTLKATQALWNRCKHFSQLPTEIQIHIFTFVDDHEAYRNCLLTSKRFYQLSKPFLYRSIRFTSTYRFAQFITCIRINSALGCYVYEVDLSQLKPGNWELEMNAEEGNDAMESDDLFENPASILAGWRDWKFKNNPLYALHPAAAIPLTKAISNSSLNSNHAPKTAKLTRYFKKRRRSSGSVSYAQVNHHTNHPTNHNTHANTNAIHNSSAISNNWHTHANAPHPNINKFLMNYSSSKDVPVGYVLHLINLCPNLERLNFGNLSLSSDYRIVQPMAHKYQSYDVMNNYHKDLFKVIDSISPKSMDSSIPPFNEEFLSWSKDNRFESSASSVFSINTFSKPIRKYNSLLPPLPKSVVDFLYLSKGDGRVYLSDLNLKSITNMHLEVVNESEVFQCLSLRSERLQNVNLSSMISINMKMVREFLVKMLMADLEHKNIDGRELLLFCGKYFEVGEPISNKEDSRKVALGPRRSGLKVLDLTDSGMYKNLQWAQKIDTDTYEGQKLIHRIINEELISSFEEYVIRERIRRGRIGENYFS
ncbi:CIC11C00000003810 [Sungouiella intermedia]|uniref:CIC11C00000003810 n=1 Tax=Sungouiella intermedia TaxID=45354 RepID=A0A1L0C0V9_9ASCO|nr:CIC11C00000003810 [[Candida] intermedia]